MAHQNEERLAWLALIPLVMTGGYYLLPRVLQAWTFIQFLPQICSYVCLFVWIQSNSRIGERLGVIPFRLGEGIQWGGVTGIFLGVLNTCLILWVVPGLGWDIAFLKDTPHAKVPVLMMMPWGILAIATLVELNFRGFLLGRLVVLFERKHSLPLKEHDQLSRSGAVLAAGCSALAFSFDPFMVGTFHHLHWIAVWDGLVWGWLRLRLHNLVAVIIAHAVEVMIMYMTIRAMLL